MKALLTTLCILFATVVYSQGSHTILIEYWQDGTVMDTTGRVWQECRCLMAFTQTIVKDYDAYVLADTTLTAIHEYMQSSPWIIKEAQCRGNLGKYDTILNPWQIKMVFLR